MKRVLVITLIAALAACSGGASTIAPIRTGGGGNTTSQARALVTFSLKVPAAATAASARRSPQYISVSTQSLVVMLTAQNGTALTTQQSYASNLSSCPTVSGTTTCTLAVPASVGSDTFTVATYDAPQSSGTPTTLTGNVLATAPVTATVVAGAANAVTLTLNGVVASVTLALLNPTPPTGTAATIGLTVTAKDADGNVIVGTYANPIALADGDTSGATALSTTSVTSSSNAVSVAYNGNTAYATFTATTPSAPAATTTLASAISKIWVADSRGAINSFTPSGTPSTPQITNGIDGPYAMTTDAAGNLYVTNVFSNTVTKYSPSGNLLLTITGVYNPFGVAVDASGKIYVLNNQPPAVLTYNASGMPTTPTIALPSTSTPYGLAVDTSGTIYVSENTSNTVNEYSATGSLEQTISGLQGPIGIASDRNGKIYVVNNSNNSVTTYAVNGVATTPTITNQLSFPIGLAVDQLGNIYVANAIPISAGVTIYDASGTLTSTIPTAGPTNAVAVF